MAAVRLTAAGLAVVPVAGPTATGADVAPAASGLAADRTPTVGDRRTTTGRASTVVFSGAGAEWATMGRSCPATTAAVRSGVATPMAVAGFSTTAAVGSVAARLGAAVGTAAELAASNSIVVADAGAVRA